MQVLLLMKVGLSVEYPQEMMCSVEEECEIITSGIDWKIQLYGFLWALQAASLSARFLVFFQSSEYFGVLMTMVCRYIPPCSCSDSYIDFSSFLGTTIGIRSVEVSFRTHGVLPMC